MQAEKRRRAPACPGRVHTLAWGAWQANGRTLGAVRWLSCSSSSSQHALIGAGVAHQAACLPRLQPLLLRSQRAPRRSRLLAVAKAGRQPL